MPQTDIDGLVEDLRPAFIKGGPVELAIEDLRRYGCFSAANALSAWLADDNTLKHRAVAALEALRSAEDREGWRSMDRAPKDGTKIDLLFPFPRGRTIDCFWGSTAVYGAGMWIWRAPTWDAGVLLDEDRWTVHCYPNLEPIAWMPAAPLPETETPAQEAGDV